MIGVYTKNVGGVWFGVACDEQRVFGTSFAARLAALAEESKPKTS